MVTLLAYTVLECFFNLVRQIYREHLFVRVGIPDKTARATELTNLSSGKVAIISEEKEQNFAVAQKLKLFLIKGILLMVCGTSL